MAESFGQMDEIRRQPILTSGLDVPFTARSTRFLSQWLFGQAGSVFALVVTRGEGEIQIGHAVYSGLRPGMTFDQLERSGFMWLADPELLSALRSRLVDLADEGGPNVLPYRRCASLARHGAS